MCLDLDIIMEQSPSQNLYLKKRKSFQHFVFTADVGDNKKQKKYCKGYQTNYPINPYLNT